MNTESLICEYAARDYSKHRVAQLLGIRYKKLNDILEILGLFNIFRPQTKIYSAFGTTGTLPELTIEFGVVGVCSVRERLKRGYSVEQALTSKPRCDMKRRSELHTAFGKTLPLKDLIDQFAVVTEWSVLDRLDRGFGIENALAMPRQDQVWAKTKKHGHYWSCLESASYDELQAKRLRPTAAFKRLR